MDLVAVNHWDTAIATHSKNHPQARHYVQDIVTVRPHLLLPEGYLDLLMALPTCTHHSVARGGKPTLDQQRSDPWHIVTWLTELRVKRFIIENVWEFNSWGPVDRRIGKPVASRKGEYFGFYRTSRAVGWRRAATMSTYGEHTFTSGPMSKRLLPLISAGLHRRAGLPFSDCVTIVARPLAEAAHRYR